MSSVFVLRGPSAWADVCEVDLSLDTADSDVQYDLIFGEVVNEDSAAGAVAVCLAERADLDEDTSEPVLVAYVEAGSGGACATMSEERSCSGDGCSEVAIRTDSSRNIMIHRGRGGFTCRNEWISHTDDSVTVVDVPEEWQLTVYNDASSGSQGFIDGQYTCDVNEGSNSIYYGQGYYLRYGLRYSCGCMYVCSNDDIQCQYADSGLDESSDYVRINDNSEYGNLITTPGGATYACDPYNYYWVEEWDDANWEAYMRIYGEEGADFIVGSPNSDILDGGIASDLIWGMDGNDDIYGSTGDDALYGDDGVDELYGQGGNDDLYGGADSDWLDGGSGYDYMNGGGGTDGCDGADANPNTCPTGDCCEIPECENRWDCATQ